MNFKFLEHPTDLRMQVWGTSQEELFLQAARGMMRKMVPLRGPGDPAMLQSQSLRLNAPAVEDLFVLWLNELLYQFTVHDFYFAGAAFADLTPQYLRATIQGWPVAQAKLDKGHGVEIKAATYHGLKILRTPRWETEVILDV